MIKRFATLAASSAATLGLMGAAGMAASTPVLAGGSTGGAQCNQLIGVNIVYLCDVNVNGNQVVVTILNLTNTLNNNQILDVENVLNNTAVQVENDNILDQVNILSGATVNVLDNDNVLICQVKAVELGITNTNIATCN
jgi:hypothetical protein